MTTQKGSWVSTYIFCNTLHYQRIIKSFSVFCLNVITPTNFVINGKTKMVSKSIVN